jgi:hypothetical protein
MGIEIIRRTKLVVVAGILGLLSSSASAAGIVGKWQNDQEKFEFLSDNTCIEQHIDSYYGPSCTTIGCNARWGMISTWRQSSQCAWDQLNDGRVHLLVNGGSYLVSVSDSTISIDAGGRTIIMQRGN